MTIGYLLQRDSAARAAQNLDFCRLWLIFCNLERSRLILGLRVWKGTKNLAGELSSARFKIPESPIRVPETQSAFLLGFCSQVRSRISCGPLADFCSLVNLAVTLLNHGHGERGLRRVPADACMQKKPAIGR